MYSYLHLVRELESRNAKLIKMKTKFVLLLMQFAVPLIYRE